MACARCPVISGLLLAHNQFGSGESRTRSYTAGRPCVLVLGHMNALCLRHRSDAAVVQESMLGEWCVDDLIFKFDT